MRVSVACGLLLAAAAATALELVTEDDPPHNMLAGDKVVGIATEKIEEAFRRTGAPARITLMPWARAYQLALSQPDYCVFSAARTPEREALFKWVGPVASMDWVLYARADHPGPKPTRLEDVRKETIGGYLQDVISVWLAEQGYTVETAPSDNVNPKKLLAGRFQYWASSRSRASILIAKDNLGARIVPVLTFRRTDLYLACNRAVQDDLVQRLNISLLRMKDDGTAARIDARYARWPIRF